MSNRECIKHSPSYSVSTDTAHVKKQSANRTKDTKQKLMGNI